MQRPTPAGIAHRFLTLIAWAPVFLIQAALSLFALICLFGVLIQVADKGGGSSGIEARRRVTVRHRSHVGVLSGSLGVLSAVGAIRLSRCYRPIALSYPRVGSGVGDGHDGAKPASRSVQPDLSVSEIWDRELDGSP
jgi:hypothetical protein